VTLNLGNHLVDVVDFNVTCPVWRIGIGNDSAPIEDAGDWLGSRAGEPTSAVLVWHRHVLERPADGRGVECFDRFDITRIESIPDEISVCHELPPCCSSLPTPKAKRNFSARQLRMAG
jgi:hypothetical protein